MRPRMPPFSRATIPDTDGAKASASRWLSPDDHPRLVVRRGEEAGDHQLPHVQAREGRSFLREDLRPGQGLGVLLRQVQAHPLPRHGLRPLRRRGDPLQGAPRAHGPHRAGRARSCHIWFFKGLPLHDRQPAGHVTHAPGADHLLRRLHRRRTRATPSSSEAASEKRSTARLAANDTADEVRRQDGRRGGQADLLAKSGSRSTSAELAGARWWRRSRPEDARKISSACSSSRPSASPATARSGWCWTSSRSSRRTCGRWSRWKAAASPPPTSTTCTAASSTATTA